MQETAAIEIIVDSHSVATITQKDILVTGRIVRNAEIRLRPKYEPTKCSKCGAVIILSEGGYSSLGRNYFCEVCTRIEQEKRIREWKQKS